MSRNRKGHLNKNRRKQRSGGRDARADLLRMPRVDAPHSVETLLREGVGLLASGDLVQAARRFEQIRSRHPQHHVALNCLGIVRRHQGQFKESASLLREALRIRPDFAEAHSNLGNTLRELEQDTAAISHFRRAIELKPGLAEAQNNLGVLLFSEGNYAAAIEHFQAALAINPQFADALNNLGNTYREMDQLEVAGDCFRRALQLTGGAEVHNNLANVLRDLGDLPAARTHYHQALRLRPGFAEAADNLGTLLVDLHDYSGAVQAYLRTVQLKPDSVDSLLNLGNAYKQQAKLDEARAVYQRACDLEPHNRMHQLRLATLCPAVFSSQDALDDYRREVAETWDAASDADLSSQPLLKTRLAEPPFALQFLDGNLRSLKQTYASIFARRFPQFEPRRRRGKPRIGLVVTRTHEGIFLRSLRGVLQRLPEALADITIVCPRSSMRMLKESLGGQMRFSTLPQSFAQVVEQVRSAEFDVLYYWEIGTDVTNYFLPFLRLAPVQCTSWGVQVTSGIDNVDYYLSSSLVEPESAAEHYSEQLLLSDTLLTYQHTHPPAQPLLSRDDLGLPGETHLYVCPQQLGKFHPEFDRCLQQILARDRHGTLAVIEDQHGTASRILRGRLAQSLGADLERVVFLPRQDRRGYESLLKAADILLDPPHFVGVNTTYDAMMLGKPIVTRPSNFHRGRYTAGCYRKIGFDSCLVTTEEEYIQRAIELASDATRRRAVEREVATAAASLFEDQRAVDEHVRLFGDLIEVARSG